jgi:serine/threonine protein kinase
VVAKVADFGLSRTKENSVTYSNQTLNTGTTRWMAPEVIKSCTAESQGEKSNGEAIEASYPFKRDIYSFAMVCYEILTGDMPFSSTSSQMDVKKMVLDGVRPPLPYECPLLLKHLIERCWSPDARERPRFDEICAELRYFKYLFLSPCKCLFLITFAIFYSCFDEAKSVHGLSVWVSGAETVSMMI